MAADYSGSPIEHRFDLSLSRADARRFAFPVGPYTVCSAQVLADYNISGSFTVTFYRSNDGVTGSAPEEGAQALTAEGFTQTLFCGGYLWLIAEVTTAATSGFVRVMVVGKADQ